jgi:hypothetical protein
MDNIFPLMDTSKLATGSSAIIKLGLVANTLAIPSRRLSPPLKYFGLALAF